MLKISWSMKDLNCAQLAAVYEESVSLSGERLYPYLAKNMQLLQAQKDFYLSLEQFFLQESSVYAVWLLGEGYAAALRIERYLDGYLIAGLETAPNARCNGYATSLLSDVLAHLSKNGAVRVYSHIDKNNYASLRVHKKCGFFCIMDHAVFLDGSVSHGTLTYCYEK